MVLCQSKWIVAVGMERDSGGEVTDSVPDGICHNPVLGRLRQEGCCELEPVWSPQKVLSSQGHLPRLCQHKTET